MEPIVFHPENTQESTGSKADNNSTVPNGSVLDGVKPMRLSVDAPSFNDETAQNHHKEILPSLAIPMPAHDTKQKSNAFKAALKALVITYALTTAAGMAYVTYFR